MTGKKGMIGSGGARAGAGAPYKFAPRKHEHFIMERETVGGEIRPPELLVFLAVEDGGNTLVFRYGDDIIVIRRPDPGELTLNQPSVYP